LWGLFCKNRPHTPEKAFKEKEYVAAQYGKKAQSKRSAPFYIFGDAFISADCEGSLTCLASRSTLPYLGRDFKISHFHQ